GDDVHFPDVDLAVDGSFEPAGADSARSDTYAGNSRGHRVDFLLCEPASIPGAAGSDRGCGCQWFSALCEPASIPGVAGAHLSQNGSGHVRLRRDAVCLHAHFSRLEWGLPPGFEVSPPRGRAGERRGTAPVFRNGHSLPARSQLFLGMALLWHHGKSELVWNVFASPASDRCRLLS